MAKSTGWMITNQENCYSIFLLRQNLADSASFVTKMKMKWKHLNNFHFQPELESVLRRHKSQFVSLLKNPVRNSGDAALVRKASSEGIKLSSGDGSSVTQRLPPQMVDEAFIISDMFELNEISSLQLLLQGLSRATWTKHSMNEWRAYLYAWHK